MSLKHGLLGLLNYGSMTGYELDKTFKDSLNFFWQAQTSQIYRELNTMNKNEWITYELVYQDDKPNKKVYTITDKGREELEKWLAISIEDEKSNVRDSFLMKVFFSGERSKEENIAFLKKYKRMCEEQLIALKGIGESTEEYSKKISDNEKALYWRATALHGVYHCEMSIKWADEVISQLEGLV